MSPADTSPIRVVADGDPSLDELASQVRHLVEFTVRTRVDDAVLRSASRRLADAATALETRLAGGTRRMHDDPIRSHANPVLGSANPFAPPVRVEVVDGAVVGHARLHRAYEGPPGQVHGGVLALLLDQTLGLANVVAGVPGMTRSLHVRFHRPTPLDRDLVVHSVHAHVEGRDIVAQGSIDVDGTRTVTAEGVFRALSAARGRAYFADTFGVRPDGDTRR